MAVSELVLYLEIGTLGRRHVAVGRNRACVPGARQAWTGISALSLSMGPQVTDLTLNDFPQWPEWDALYNRTFGAGQ